MSKRECKAYYLNGEIGLSCAMMCLMFDHGLDRGESFRYLGL
jgi:hypothetical protein